MDTSWFEYFIWGVIIVLMAILVWVFAVGLPMSLENKRRFVEACTQAGGVPSNYNTMIGKTSVSERLCIKKENIVEIGE